MRKLFGRLVISSVAYSIFYPFINNKGYFLVACGVLIVWNDIFKLIPSFKNNKKKHLIIINSSNDSESLSDNSTSSINSSERRKSWKRELKIDTSVDTGSFIDDDLDKIPVKLNSNSSNIDSSNEESSVKQEKKVRRRRAGKKVRERLARKYKQFEIEKEKENESSSNCNNADIDTNNSEQNPDTDYNTEHYIEQNTNTFSDENEKEVFNSLNNEDYESEESEFNERQLEEFYSEDTILFEIPKPSKQYYEFLKETVERINSYDCGICIYNDIDEEYKLTNDSDVNDFVDAIDKMINHRYIDYDTSRLVDPDLYWSDTYLRKLDKHINKYGKSGEFVSYNQDINELLSQLNELKEITSVLRLCGCKLKGKRSRGMLRVNMWWMNRLLGEDLIRMKIKDDDGGENKKLVIGLNRMWVHMGNNMQCLMESWDSDQEIWSD